MPRKARLKSEDAIFHIMCKSISEVNLFKDAEDKEKYIVVNRPLITTFTNKKLLLRNVKAVF